MFQVPQELACAAFPYHLRTACFNSVRKCKVVKSVVAVPEVRFRSYGYRNVTITPCVRAYHKQAYSRVGLSSKSGSDAIRERLEVFLYGTRAALSTAATKRGAYTMAISSASGEMGCMADG